MLILMDIAKEQEDGTAATMRYIIFNYSCVVLPGKFFRRYL